ncbi:MAG: hypothetical protein JWM99_499 [Verrucomicrobiales bacterium]|nr:hypothetical protein [Verrucomicrobiales bacterium]
MSKLEKTITQVVQALPNLGHWGTGIIYIAMGLLAALTAIGFKNHSADMRGSLLAIKDLPFGDFILIGLLVCLTALTLWRILQAVVDLEDQGKGWKGLWHRMQFLAGASVYLGISTLILKILLNIPGRSIEQVAQREASQMNTHREGWLLVVAIGVGIGGFAAFQFYRSFRGDFRNRFHWENMNGSQKNWCFTLGRVGYGARGLILGIMSYFCIRSGIEVNSHLAHGQAGVMHAMLNNRVGIATSLVIGIGLIAFGLFETTMAKYGRFPHKKVKEKVHDAVKL